MKYIPICHANPQDIVEYKNVYIMSENKTNKYTIEMYTQDQVDKIEKELKAKIESYKADAERYMWLRDNNHLDEWWLYTISKEDAENINEAIDQAMKEGKDEV